MAKRLSYKNRRNGQALKKWYLVKDERVTYNLDQWMYYDKIYEVKLGTLVQNYAELADYGYGRINKFKVHLQFEDKIFNTDMYSLRYPHMVVVHQDYFNKTDIDSAALGSYRANSYFEDTSKAGLTSAEIGRINTNCEKMFSQSPGNIIPFSKKMKLRKNVVFRTIPKTVELASLRSAWGDGANSLMEVTDKRFYPIYAGIPYQMNKSFILPPLERNFEPRPATGATEWGFKTNDIKVHLKVYAEVECYRRNGNMLTLSPWPTATKEAVAGARSAAPSPIVDFTNVAEQIHSVKKELQDAVTDHIVGGNPLLAGAASILGLNAKRPRYELKH